MKKKDEKPKLKVVCAWCGKVLVEGSGPVSHGICAECAQEVGRG